MHKKGLVIGIIILMLGVNIGSTFAGDVDVKTMSSVGFDGNTLYVGGSGPNNYSSIQSAINDASDGDTIFVFVGTYWGIVHIDKSINLKGENRISTIIVGEVYLEHDGILVSGFTIRAMKDEYSRGFRFDSDNNIIRDNIVREHRFGMTVWESSNNIIEGNVVENNDMSGIIVWWSCNNNIIRDNVVRFHSEDGIRLVGQHNNNEVSNNIIENNSDGIDIWDNPTLDNVYNNVIKNNSNGIRFSRGNEINILGNIIENNGNGIYFISGSNNIFSENHLQNNGIGIYLRSGGNTIEKNNFIGNESHATFVTNGMLNRNQWRRNYWSRPRLLPKVITGKFVISNPYGGSREFFWINIDWRPAQEPYDIGV